jgi:hypothetical protein
MHNEEKNLSTFLTKQIWPTVTGTAIIHLLFILIIRTKGYFLALFSVSFLFCAFRRTRCAVTRFFRSASFALITCFRRARKALGLLYSSLLSPSKKSTVCALSNFNTTP